MRGLGSYGLVVGGAIGVLAVLLLALITRPAPLPVVATPPAISPDVTIFISERSVSRLASEALQRPTQIDFEANGRMKMTTPLKIGQLEPPITAGLFLELQGTDVVSELDWIQVGFLTFPASWLPQSVVAASAQVGQVIKDQTPRDFVLIGLTTGAEGVNIQLKWLGQ